MDDIPFFIFSVVMIVFILSILGIIALPVLLVTDKIKRKSVLNKFKKERGKVLSEYEKIGIHDPARIDFFDGKNKAIAIDLKSRQIFLYDKLNSYLNKLNFSGIVQCDIIEDYDYINESKEGGSLVGHAIGTLLGGNIGGVIGGILTSSRQIQTVKQIGLNLLYKNNTIYRIIFMGEECDNSNISKLSASNLSNDWDTIINHIIHNEILAQEHSGINISSTKIRFHCKICGQSFKVSSKHAGKKIRCKECNNYLRIPIVPLNKKVNKVNKQDLPKDSGRCYLCAKQIKRNPYKLLFEQPMCWKCTKLLMSKPC